MKYPLFILTLLSSILCANPPAKVTASWLVADSQRANPAVIRTIVKMEIKNSWHIYWSNPGESGLPPSVEATLPNGWKIGDIEFPPPIRFKTGELFGFGYENTVYFPLDLTPPTGFKGALPELTADLSWLVCNDSACLPGQVEIKLTKGDHANVIDASYSALPAKIPGAVLMYSLDGNEVSLELKLPDQSGIDPAMFEIMPVTPDFIDPSANPQFSKHPQKNHTWTSTAPKSKYIQDNPKALKILLKNKAGESYFISSGKP